MHHLNEQVYHRLIEMLRSPQGREIFDRRFRIIRPVLRPVYVSPGEISGFLPSQDATIHCVTAEDLAEVLKCMHEERDVFRARFSHYVTRAGVARVALTELRKAHPEVVTPSFTMLEAGMRKLFQSGCELIERWERNLREEKQKPFGP